MEGQRMEATVGIRNLQESDNRSLELGSYGNEAFLELDEHSLADRREMKQVETSERKFEEDPLSRFVPKSAWNEDCSPVVSRNEAENRGLEEGIGTEGCNGLVESEISFISNPYAPQEADDLETMVAGLERNIHLTKNSLEEWNKRRNRAGAVASSAHQEVERRKASLVEAIEEYSKGLHDGIDGQLSAFEEESGKAMERLEESLTSMQKSFDLRSQLNYKDSKSFRDHLLTWLAIWKASKVPYKSLFPAVLSTTEAPIDGAVLEGLFGVSKRQDSDDRDRFEDGGKALANGNDQRIYVAPEKVKTTLRNQGLRVKSWIPPWRPPSFQCRNSDSSKRPRIPATFRIKYKIRDHPELVLTVSCRLKKDKRICGITDLALTDKGQILALDKNNKVVKMFDSQGILLRYFGKNDLRKPSRISCIRSKGQVAVTDESSNRVLIFSEDGQFLSQLVALHRPVSHCQLTDTRVAILEFSTKSVVVCDLSGVIISTFPTHLDCPSYVACTKSDNIVITDWKSESYKIFDSTGSEKFSYCRRTSAESSRHVEEPYGVCADDDGLVLMADRKRREIVVCSEEGTEVWSYDAATSQIGVPFAIDCNGSGILAIAEYSGTVRLFKYKTSEVDGERTTEVIACNDRIHGAPAAQPMYATAIPPRVL